MVTCRLIIRRRDLRSNSADYGFMRTHNDGAGFPDFTVITVIFRYCQIFPYSFFIAGRNSCRMPRYFCLITHHITNNWLLEAAPGAVHFTFGQQPAGMYTLQILPSDSVNSSLRWLFPVSDPQPFNMSKLECSLCASPDTLHKCFLSQIFQNLLPPRPETAPYASWSTRKYTSCFTFSRYFACTALSSIRSSNLPILMSALHRTPCILLSSHSTVLSYPASSAITDAPLSIFSLHSGIHSKDRIRWAAILPFRVTSCGNHTYGDIPWSQHPLPWEYIPHGNLHRIALWTWCGHPLHPFWSLLPAMSTWLQRQESRIVQKITPRHPVSYPRWISCWLLKPCFCSRFSMNIRIFL